MDMLENFSDKLLVESDVSLLFVLVFVESNYCVVYNFIGVFAGIDELTILTKENKFFRTVVDFKGNWKFVTGFCFENV